MTLPRIALVTCDPMPEPDPDEGLLENAIREAGGEPVSVGWRSDFDWSSVALAVPRTTWDYYRHHDEFLAWAERVDAATTLLNPLSVIRANTDKRYLATLERAGVPVVPTAVVEPGDPIDLGALLDERGWDAVVLKPTVGAASHRARRASRSDLADEHLANLARDGGALVQPLMSGVVEPGEHSCVHIDGELSHVIRKEPRLEGDHESVSERAIPLPDGAADTVARALATIDEPLLYGRVDVVRADDGTWVVMELELTEPSLFLKQHPPAIGRLAEAMVREARRT